MQKLLADDPMWKQWQTVSSQMRDQVDYTSNPVVKFFNQSGHHLAERGFSQNDYFPSVLEVGAGTGEHLQYIKHSYDTYYSTDFSESSIVAAKGRHKGKKNVVFETQNALDLTYSDQTFDRLISIYTLEHLPNPHEALMEWKRVVKTGGVIDVVIPTEGGIAWNLGRYLTTRRQFKKMGLDLDYIIAREHINACYRLVSLLRHYFQLEKEVWFPAAIPTPHLNLVYHFRTRVNR